MDCKILGRRQFRHVTILQDYLAFNMAAFNVLVQWHGFRPNASGFVPLSMVEFSL